MSGLAVIEQTKIKIDFTKDQIELVKTQIMSSKESEVTDDELDLFLNQCRRTGLDPFARQIFAVFRKQKDPKTGKYIEKMSIQTSIDGFRVVAERSGDYGGQGEPEFISENGKLVCAKVPVFRFRGDIRYQASVGIARMSEFAQNNPMWTKMPYTMLAKCAEAQALRKAYPQDLSGLYTNDEMAQAENENKLEKIEEKEVIKEYANQESIKIIKNMIEELNMHEISKTWLQKANVHAFEDFTQEQANKCIAYMRNKKLDSMEVSCGN